MKKLSPWKEKQFKYEELFESLIHFKEDQNKLQVSKALIVLIALCKDVDKVNNKEEFWGQILIDILDLEVTIKDYFKSK